MTENIKAYSRNPQVLRKLIRFTGFVPANLVDNKGKLVAAAKIPVQHQEELLKAQGEQKQVDIELEGKNYRASVTGIHKDEVENIIDEIDLAVIS